MGGAIMTKINNTLTFNGTVYFTDNGHYGKVVSGFNFGGGDPFGELRALPLPPTVGVLLPLHNNHI